jgi:hypothetical protein
VSLGASRWPPQIVIRYVARGRPVSFDLYLLPLKPNDDADTAMEMLERVESGDAAGQFAALDVRTASDVLQRLEPKYTAFPLDHNEISKAMNISVADAKSRFNYVEMNGPEDADPPLAQFTFHRNGVVVHWYGGTTESEMFSYLKAIAKQAALSLLDPQDGKVYRLNASGEFA